jgi:hypothetical protein
MCETLVGGLGICGRLCVVLFVRKLFERKLFERNYTDSWAQA